MKHRIQAKKLNRSSNHRQALFKNLIASLVLNREIITTEAKAKTIRRLVEKLVTKAKKGTLHHRRQIHAFFNNKQVTSLLVDQLAPQMKDRTSGFTRLSRLGYRLGDNAMLTKLTFTDTIVINSPSISTTKTKSVSSPKKTLKNLNSKQ